MHRTALAFVISLALVFAGQAQTLVPKKLSQLPVTSSVISTDMFVVNHDAGPQLETSQISVSDLFASISLAQLGVRNFSDLQNVTAVAINNATTDADFALSDHTHTSSTISGIDISADTNLAGDAEVVLTGDSLSLAASIARDAEVALAYSPLGHTHNSSTISGLDISDDTNLAGTANEITLTGDTLSAHAALTRDSEWDTAAKINAATTDADFSVTTHTHTSSSISALDISDDTNLAGTANEITLTDDTLSAHAALTRDTEWDTAAKINAATTDDDLLTLTGTQTATNKTLASPRIATAILDTSGNELMNLTATATAVNELTLSNAAAGNGPVLSATGGDTNVPLTVSSKGSGNILLTPGSSGQVKLPTNTFLLADVITGTAGAFNPVNFGSTTALASIGTYGARLRSTYQYQWTNSANASAADTVDTALARNAAGVIEINNGTAGTFRDLQLRHVTASGIASAVQLSASHATQSATILRNAAGASQYVVGRSFANDNAQNFFIYDQAATAFRLYLGPTGGFDLTGGSTDGGAGNLKVTALDAASITQDSVTAPTLQNSWVNFGSGYENVGYYKDREGRVWLTGMISGGTTTAGTLLFTLPVGYRPTANKLLTTLSNYAALGLIVYSNGEVQLGSAANATWVSLCGLSFRP